MRFHADLHIHSKYSRATSRDCDLENLSYWARKKGIAVVGTGDFTHPAWNDEIRTKLVPAEPGLFRLREDLEREVERWLSSSTGAPTRFMLSVEISNIYKRDDKTRKIHNLVYAPDLESCDRIIERLSRIGNLRSDGRPILGLDSRDLLEIVLEAGEGCYLVPAHIWTPWFAVLGSKSGFDAVEHCFADLADHIFAVETGLSSDPDMNWRLSSLDRYRLVSNSDAHSPQKLGRETTVFDTELDYFAVRRALETGRGFCGTVEFFPEEGKYHLDGHRKCGARLSPKETLENNGRCPGCGNPVTVGVLHRIESLADRDEGVRPEGAASFRSFVPLPEIIAETVGTKSGSKAVARTYETLTSRVAPELSLLEETPIEDIEKQSSELIAEGIARMRAGKVIRQAGYDGEYGVIRMFTDDEIRTWSAPTLFALSPPTEPKPEEPGAPRPERRSDPPDPPVAREAPAAIAAVEENPAAASSRLLEGLDAEQAAAARAVRGPVLIIAGPGTGKTRTLTHRIAHLIEDHGALPECCLAVTFTHRAAEELRERLATLMPERAAAVAVHTFHSLGLTMLREHPESAGLPDDFQVALEVERIALLMEGLQVPERRARKLLQEISRSKRTLQAPEPGSELEQALHTYDRHLRASGKVDFDDLIALPVSVLRKDPERCAGYRRRYRYLSIDEYQDIDPLQYDLVRLLAPPAADLCAIGDPDQAIYSFRGADVGFFTGFREHYPEARVVQLSKNYRCGRVIVDASNQMIASASLVPDRRLLAAVEDSRRIALHEAPTERAEAEYVVHTIERTLGGYSFFSVDSGRVETGEGADVSFSDFAVLYRSKQQIPPLVEALSRSGVPFQVCSHAKLSELALVDQLLRSFPDDEKPVVELLRAAAERLTQASEQEVSTSELDSTLDMLRPLARRAGADRAAFMTQVATTSEIDLWDPRADRVSLLTLHAAKGLEFDVVFLVGCEDGIVPHRFSSDPGADVDEERRLLYVGMTRAKRWLFVSHARRRLWRGKVRDREPSPFLRDIEQELLEHKKSEAPAKEATAQLSLWS